MHNHRNDHTNAYLDLDGVPYVLAEYIDRREIKQIDHSWIKSEIHVDQNEAMRAVVHISIDDIGRRASDGLPSIVGNRTKKDRFIKLIQNNIQMLDHQLGVVRRGLIMRVRYQVENAATGHVMRTMTEDLRIPNREYFLYINPRQVDDNGIVTNFADTLVSTINDFVHGRERMVMRITKVQMLYEGIRPDRYVNSWMSHPGSSRYPWGKDKRTQEYYYHDEVQHKQYLHNDGRYHIDNHDDEDVCPPDWMMLNRYYHFDHDGRDLCLHFSEINDKSANVVLIPCGTVNVNKRFMVNPGHRIVFQFSVWKNDLVSINDSRPIAHALRAPYIPDYVYDKPDDCKCDDDMPFDKHDHVINPDQDALMDIIHNTNDANMRQNHAINDLTKMIMDLQARIDDMDKHGPHHHREEHHHHHHHHDDCHDHHRFPLDCTCMVNDHPFKTVQDAINAVETGELKGDVVLIRDIEEYLTVKGNVTIDLSTHIIAAPHRIDDTENHHTITVDGGNLVIRGQGEVTNDSKNGCCIINLGETDTVLPDGGQSVGMGVGTVVIAGGYIHRTAVDSETPGSVVVNHGAHMKINHGVSIGSDNDVSPLIVNGYTGNPNYSPMMTINGGKHNGGTYTLMNDQGGLMIINDGEFVMGKPWVDTEGGPKGAIINEDRGRVTIRSGRFVGAVENNNSADKSIQISGGSFSVDIKEHLVDGYDQNISGEVIRATE